MAALTTVPPQVQPPPDVPSIPGQNANLTSYLRRFSIWATAQFASRVPTNQAVQSIMMQAPNNSVWRLYVNNNGNFLVAQVPLGGGSPTASQEATPANLP